jgi:hypothetical protein
MARAKTDNSTTAPDGLRSPQDLFYLPTDISPEEVFQAIGRLRKEARDEIDRLIRFLDESENHMEREPEDEDDTADAEPSLGSFDRMTNQDKSWRRTSLWAFPAVDGEQDDADREDSDPAEESEASGIGDYDGLLEQVGSQDWQQGGQG